MTMRMSRLLHVVVTLLMLVGLCNSYFPGLKPDDKLNKLCQQAQVYTAGGSMGTGKHSIAISPSMDSYIPRTDMQVSVTSNEPIVGLILQARKLGTSLSFGKFKLPSGEEASLKNCDREKDSVFLWLDEQTKNVTVTWTPPTTDEGSLHFIARVFEPDGTYWSNITSSVFSLGFAPITVDTCGVEKGCFRYSSEDPECDEDTCEYLLTYVVEGSVVHFEMVGDLGWVGVGFSSDDMMGGDDVFMCLNLQTGPEVRKYWTEYQHNTPVIKEPNPLFNREATVGENGKIKCRFSRKLKVTGKYHVDLNNDWYQIYVWGEVSDSGHSIMRHRKPSPPTSSRKITLWQKINVMSAASVSGVSLTMNFISITLTCMLFRN